VISMKTMTSLKGVAAILIAAALTITAIPVQQVSAAGAARQPIEVVLDDEPIDFDVPPVVQNQTVYVEFRSLFQALGFTVAYNEKTKVIAGVSKKTRIQMKLGSSDTLVNGVPSSVPAKPIAINGRTLVPLRFIGEATGLIVKWDSAANAVFLDYKPPTEADIKAIQALFNKQEQYYSKKDLKGFTSTFTEDSPIREDASAAFEERLANDAKTVQTFDNFELEDWKVDNASVWYDATTKKTNQSGFFMDRVETVYARVELAADGSWKLYDIYVMDREFLNAEELVKNKVEVPVAEQNAIQSLFQTHLGALNSSNVKGVLATYDLEDWEKELMAEQYEEFFESYKMKHAFEEVSIIYYQDNKAYVYVKQARTMLEDRDEYADEQLYWVYGVKKNEAGKWLITSYDLFKTEEM